MSDFITEIVENLKKNESEEMWKKFEKTSQDWNDEYLNLLLGEGDFTKHRTETSKTLADIGEKVEPERYKNMSEQEIYKSKLAEGYAALWTEKDKIRFDRNCREGGSDISSKDSDMQEYYKAMEIGVREQNLNEKSVDEMEESIAEMLSGIDINTPDGIRMLRAFNISMEMSDIKSSLSDEGYSNSELMEKYAEEREYLEKTEAARFTDGYEAKNYANYYFEKTKEAYRNSINEQGKETNKEQSTEIKDVQSNDMQLQTTQSNGFFQNIKEKLSKISENIKNLFNGNQQFEKEIVEPAQQELNEMTEESQFTNNNILNDVQEFLNKNVVEKVNDLKENVFSSFEFLNGQTLENENFGQLSQEWKECYGSSGDMSDNFNSEELKNLSQKLVKVGTVQDIGNYRYMNGEECYNSTLAEALATWDTEKNRQLSAQDYEDVVYDAMKMVKTQDYLNNDFNTNKETLSERFSHVGAVMNKEDLFEEVCKSFLFSEKKRWAAESELSDEQYYDYIKKYEESIKEERYDKEGKTAKERAEKSLEYMMNSYNNKKYYDGFREAENPEENER